MQISTSQTRSNIVSQQQQMLRQVRIPCRYHNGSICLNYCHENSCFRFLCEQCIEEHLEYHKKTGLSVLSIRSLKKVREYCVDKVNRLLEQLYGKMQTLSSPKTPQQILEQASFKFEAVKKIMFEIIEQELNRFQDQLRAKVSQSFSTIKNLQDIHDNLSKIIMQLKQSRGIVVEGHHEMPETVEKILTIDDQMYRQTFNRQANSYTQKLGMIDFDICINQGLFRSSVSECLKINKSQTKLQGPDVEGSRPKGIVNHPNNRFGYNLDTRNLSLVPTIESAFSYLHFFETDESSLHLYDLSGVPIHHSVTLLSEDYIVPSFHASVMSANGDIFISGGKIEILRGKEDKSKWVSKFSLKSRKFKQDFAKVKKRSSHSLCEYDEYLYILGGFGMLTNSEHYEIEYAVEKVNMKTGEVKNQEPSQYGGANISVVISNCIFKASEEGVEIYNPSERRWKVVGLPAKNYMLTRGCGWAKISNDCVLVYGGYDQMNEEEPLDTCELWKISISPLSDKIQFAAVAVEDVRLPQRQGFLNNPGQCYDGMLYALQNISDETSEDNIVEGERKLVMFDGHSWKNLRTD